MSTRRDGRDIAPDLAMADKWLSALDEYGHRLTKVELIAIAEWFRRILENHIEAKSND